MEIRTTFKIEPSARKITYNDKVMFIGSCFASSIGKQMEKGHMPVLINPSGTIYNPVSVLNCVDSIISEREYIPDDLHSNDGNYFSFNHYTDFSSDDPSKTLDKINSSRLAASEFIKDTGFLFITLGTARVYRWRRSGSIVSNCHKLPQGQFDSELLSVGDIVKMWEDELEKINTLFPGLKVIFTISPVRHWKDGAHGNQISKSVLFLAVEELLKHPASPKYFPAYELLMDDLRDYRFYSDDMLHPSVAAINYIWEEFSKCYMDNLTLNTWKEVVKISKATGHRFSKTEGKGKSEFAEIILQKITDMEKKVPSLDLSLERDYFKSLL